MSFPSRDRVEGIIEPPADLDEAARRRWLQMRRMAARRHSQWRATVPEMEALFDDHVHRAKALAGNLATELGDVLRGTARIAPSAIVDRDEPTEWLVVSCRLWRTELRGEDLVGEHGAEAAEMFDAMLEQLIAREHDRAVDEALRSRSEQSRASGWIPRLIDRLAAPLRRFFRPA